MNPKHKKILIYSISVGWLALVVWFWAGIFTGGDDATSGHRCLDYHFGSETCTDFRMGKLYVRRDLETGDSSLEPVNYAGPLVKKLYEYTAHGDDILVIGELEYADGSGGAPQTTEVVLPVYSSSVATDNWGYLDFPNKSELPKLLKFNSVTNELMLYHTLQDIPDGERQLFEDMIAHKGLSLDDIEVRIPKEEAEEKIAELVELTKILRDDESDYSIFSTRCLKHQVPISEKVCAVKPD